MRTLVDIPDEDLAAITGAIAKLGISRAEFVRRAVTASLAEYRVSDRSSAFGILAGRFEDGDDYQVRVRSEWE